MRFGIHLSMTVLASAILIGSAAAQTSSQAAPVSSQAAGQGADNNWLEAPGGPGPSAWENSGAVPGGDAPERLSDGTLAESANTTALASSTYQQPTGFLPGMKP